MYYSTNTYPRFNSVEPLIFLFSDRVPVLRTDPRANLTVNPALSMMFYFILEVSDT